MASTKYKLTKTFVDSTALSSSKQVAQAREQAKTYLMMISKGKNSNKLKKQHITTAKNHKEKNRLISTVEEA